MDKKVRLVDQPDMATVTASTHVTVARFDAYCLILMNVYANVGLLERFGLNAT